MKFEGFPRSGKDPEPEQSRDASETEFDPDSLEDSAIPEIKSTFDILAARSANLDKYAHPHDEAPEEVLGEVAMLNDDETKDLRETLSRFRDKMD